MSIFKRVTLSFTISLTRTNISCILHHGNSPSKTAELIYNIFMARKCVNCNMYGFSFQSEKAFRAFQRTIISEE